MLNLPTRVGERVNGCVVVPWIEIVSGRRREETSKAHESHKTHNIPTPPPRSYKREGRSSVVQLPARCSWDSSDVDLRSSQPCWGDW